MITSPNSLKRYTSPTDMLEMQQLLAQKEKAQKEENLRMLAQRAREERSGVTPSAGGSAIGGSSKPPPVMGLGGYGSDSDSGSEDEDSEDEAAVREREEVRAEKRREREKEMRMNNMGTEMRAKLLAK
jgi:SNW domain-containing protein 1